MFPEHVIHDYINRGLINHLDFDAAEPDFAVRSNGSVYSFTPCTSAAWQLCKGTVDPDSMFESEFRVNQRDAYWFFDRIFDAGLRVS